MASGNSHSLAVKTNGTVVGWGNNTAGQSTPPIGLTNVIAVAAGDSQSLALKSDGSLWAWGQNDHGQVGDGTRSNKFAPTRISAERDWQSIEAGAFNSFALKKDGTIWGWGLDPITGGNSDSSTAQQQIDPGTNWVGLSSGDYCLLGRVERVVDSCLAIRLAPGARRDRLAVFGPQPHP